MSSDFEYESSNTKKELKMIDNNQYNFITSLPKTIKNYVAGIFFTSGKKNCAQISKFFGYANDRINKLFKNPTESIITLESDL